MATMLPPFRPPAAAVSFLTADEFAAASSERPCALICAVHPALGRVTSMGVRNGRVVAATESGIPMIVPIDREDYR